ncbi:MLO-like protein 6 [Cryptomeria japonica]|uniref:MLO-like protein 6 n=1 Tax=Cryptomeria japonica TaxID=3369 RepID=UPI0027DA6DE0|nr:MLO-like protein 6 [Cryptomeria japonica]
MAGGSDADSRSLEQTPTWAVAIVCLGFVLISILLEQAIHFLSRWLKKRRKKSLGKALDKIKEELMLLGFISLLLTVGQTKISQVCISESLGDSLLPCPKEEASEVEETEKFSLPGHHRKLMFLASEIPLRRSLATDEIQSGHCANKGKVPLISQDGLHQLHIFIFVLAVSHVLSCIVIMTLGWIKMKKWKAWEEETKTLDYEFSTDPSRFRFTRETTFGRRHMTFWSTTPIFNWIVCFFRQFVRSVPKVDYLTLRHGFILAHFAPHSRFDFQRYIRRSLDDDFTSVVSISPPLWFFAILFMLLNRRGWFTFNWLSFIPLIILLIVGTKLQVIITRMALDIQDRNPVVQGAPVVKPNDQLFWFGRPKLILYLIHFTLFQSAFQLAFFFWAWYEYGLQSCFHDRAADIIVRITCGVAVQILCSYVTLPLYALVTQLGTNMKTTIFDERIATALKKWHQRAKKNLRQKRHDDLSSGPTTPYEGSSPVHLLRKYLSSGDLESAQKLEQVEYDIEADAPSPSQHSHHNANENSKEQIVEEKQDVQTLGFELSFDHFRNENLKNVISTSHRENDSRKEDR